MHGKIVKGIAGFYYVHIVGSGVYECKAKGIFRRDGIKPLVGDDAEIEILDEKEKEGNIGGKINDGKTIRSSGAWKFRLQRCSDTGKYGM